MVPAQAVHVSRDDSSLGLFSPYLKFICNTTHQYNIYHTLHTAQHCTKFLTLLESWSDYTECQMGTWHVTYVRWWQQYVIYVRWWHLATTSECWLAVCMLVGRVYCCSYLMCIFCTVCALLFLLYMPDCWLAVTIRKVPRPATSTQVFLGFPVSISKCWDSSKDSKLPLHASHVALQT